MTITERNQRPVPEDFFADWKEREALAEAMIPMIGDLNRRHNVTCYIYGRSLVDISVIDIMQAHREVREVQSNELSEYETHPVLRELMSLNLGHAHIDVGRIAVGYMEQEGAADAMDLPAWVRNAVSGAVDNPSKPLPKPQDIVLYGFGRIGRLLARLLIEKTGGGDVLRLKAIVVRPGRNPRDDLTKRASLMQRDSVHGLFRGTIRVLHDSNKLIINGNEVQVIYADAPDAVDYRKYGINNAMVIDNSGIFRNRQGLSRHLQCPGAARVLLTAPGKDDIKNIVAGINCGELTGADDIVSAASCTTNAIVPALKIMDDEYGLVHGHMETVHSYTNDQNLIDNYHPGERRGRSAPMNMVITETGAARAAIKVLPHLAGRLTGSAIRVPTPNVSLAILSLQLKRPATVLQINDFMLQTSLHSGYRKQIDYSSSPETVSTDIVGSRTAAVFDSRATQTCGDHCTLYLWYDNEFGYCCQVRRVLESMVGVKYARYPV